MIPILAIAAIVILAALRGRDPILSRAAVIAGTCLVLWLTELVPLYATTLLLWVAIVLLLGPLDAKVFSLARVVSAANSPVMLLCFGGFVLSVAGAKYGIDAYIARWVVIASGGRRRLLLLAVMVATAVLSMWMLNIVAAAMMVATLKPLLDGEREDRSFRTALLVGLAFAANFGGIGTPIGSGPNLIAIGAVAPRHPITFPAWMLFGVPVAALMLTLTYLILVRVHRVGGSVRLAELPHRGLGRRGWSVVIIFFVTVAAWLLEPVHRVPAALIAIAMAAALFGTNLLDGSDLRKVGWDTLLLIAGGLTLGQLFEDSGLARSVAAAVPWDVLPRTALLFCLVLACASISAVASNTAAAAMLIQIALGIAPSPQVAVLVALGASMGVPFVISTPPNSMVYGEGGVRTRDLLLPGMILMLAGCAFLVLAGPTVLGWAGIPR